MVDGILHGLQVEDTVDTNWIVTALLANATSNAADVSSDSNAAIIDYLPSLTESYLVNGMYEETVEDFLRLFLNLLASQNTTNEHSAKIMNDALDSIVDNLLNSAYPGQNIPKIATPAVSIELQKDSVSQLPVSIGSLEEDGVSFELPADFSDIFTAAGATVFGSKCVINKKNVYSYSASSQK